MIKNIFFLASGHPGTEKDNRTEPHYPNPQRLDKTSPDSTTNEFQASFLACSAGMVPIAKKDFNQTNLFPVGTISAHNQRQSELNLKVHSSLKQKSLPFFHNSQQQERTHFQLKTEATSDEILTSDGDMLRKPLHKDDKTIEERRRRDEAKVEALKDKLIEFQPECQCVPTNAKGLKKHKYYVSKLNNETSIC